MADSRLKELMARTIGVILDRGVHARYEVRVRGLENFTRSPSTLVAFNHRRDADTPIIGNTLFGHRGLLAHGARPWFPAREDLFDRGFLAGYLESWPAPARALMSALDLRPFLRALQAYPLRRVAGMTLKEVLEDVLRLFGDLPLDQVLRDEWVEQFERLAASRERPLNVRQALAERFQPLLRQRYGLTKLTLNRFRELKPYEKAVIESQLQRLVDLLERGEILQFAPEGALSTDGCLGRLRIGLHTLLNRSRAPVCLLPVGITYDFMTTERQRVFVNVGRELTDLRGMRPGETADRVSGAILAQCTLTASQLASQFLLAVTCRGGEVVVARMLEQVAREAEQWTAAGFYVDPRLLYAEQRERRVAEYLEFCRRSGVLIPSGTGRYRASAWVRGAPPDWTDRRGMVNYANNELASLVGLSLDRVGTEPQRHQEHQESLRDLCDS